MTTGGTDIASYIRGRLHLAGVTDRTPIGTVLDVLLTVVIGPPGRARAMAPQAQPGPVEDLATRPRDVGHEPGAAGRDGDARRDLNPAVSAVIRCTCA
jgi:hypothetical protein